MGFALLGPGRPQQKKKKKQGASVIRVYLRVVFFFFSRTLCFAANGSGYLNRGKEAQAPLVLRGIRRAIETDNSIDFYVLSIPATLAARKF